MKSTSILTGTLVILISTTFVSPTFAGKAPTLCAFWDEERPLETCIYKGRKKTARIGASPEGYTASWRYMQDPESGFECSPEAFGGNPFESSGYTGKLECYLE